MLYRLILLVCIFFRNIYAFLFRLVLLKIFILSLLVLGGHLIILLLLVKPKLFLLGAVHHFLFARHVRQDFRGLRYFLRHHFLTFELLRLRLVFGNWLKEWKVLILFIIGKLSETWVYVCGCHVELFVWLYFLV